MVVALPANQISTQLALKHRQNHSQRQRIVAFVCSPIEEEEKKLVSLAKKLKKMNTSVDFVHFGDLEDDGTAKKLEAFSKAVKSGETSHLVTIPPSSKLLSDQLISTPIIQGDNTPTSGSGENIGGGGGVMDPELGFDPNMDPELALAIRMSLEEDRARQAREAAAREEAERLRRNELETVAEGDETAASNDEKKDDKQDDKQDEGGAGAGAAGGGKMDTS